MVTNLKNSKFQGFDNSSALHRSRKQLSGCSALTRFMRGAALVGASALMLNGALGTTGAKADGDPVIHIGGTVDPKPAQGETNWNWGNGTLTIGGASGVEILNGATAIGGSINADKVSIIRVSGHTWREPEELVPSSLSVGDFYSKGAIEVSDGGQITAANSAFMSDGGGLAVSGTGSIFHAGSTLSVTGTGSRLSIADGGSVSSGAWAEIVRGAAATISGAGSVLRTGNELRVGEPGSKIAVQDGGLVDVGTRFELSDAGTSGVVSNGGQILAKGFAAVYKGGELSVTGANSRLRTEDYFMVDDAGSKATVSNGGVISAKNNIQLLEGGSLNVGGAEGGVAQAAGSIDTPLISLGDGAKLNFNTTNGFTLAARLQTGTDSDQGTGTINQDAGVTTLAGTNSDFLGQVNVHGGTLRQGISDALPSFANYDISETGTVDLNGFATTMGDVLNAGTIHFGGAGGTVLNVSGSYAGVGGTLEMNTVLGGDNSKTDKLVIAGNSVGESYIKINNIGGTGARTRDGIEIVHVNGQSDGLFELSNGYTAADGQRVIVAKGNQGAFAYSLHKGNVTKPGDGNWYLASQLSGDGQVDPKHPTPVNPDAPVRYSAGAPVYESYMQNMMALSKAPTLQQRTGNRYVDGTAKPATADDMADPNSGVNGYGVWARVEGGHNRFDPKHSTTGMKQTINTYIMQAGVDGQFYEGEDGRLIAGITGQYGRALGKVKSVHGDGDITTNAWNLGATATWYGNSGFYVDTQGQLSWFDNDLDSRTANINLSKGRKARGYMASIEAGQRFGLDQNWSLTPQAQLSWSRIKADSFDDVWSAHVAPGTDDSLTGRLGLAADYRNSWLGSNGQMVDTTVYGIANVYQEFKSGTHITLAGVDFKTDTDKTWGGLGAGGTYAWDNNTYAVYGEGSVNTGLNNFGKNYAVKGSLGFRVKW